jgi:hypothetical protein
VTHLARLYGNINELYTLQKRSNSKMSIKSISLGKIPVNVKLISVVGKKGFNAKLAFEGLEPVLAQFGYKILRSETRASGNGSPLATRLQLKQI